MQRKNAGFTLIELIVAIMIIAVVIGFIVFGVIGSGNYWYTESGVLRELRFGHPNVAEILKTTRNVFADSVITVKEDDAIHSYCLDSNILFNYTFSDCR